MKKGKSSLFSGAIIRLKLDWNSLDAYIVMHDEHEMKV